jgi:alpha-amylase
MIWRKWCEDHGYLGILAEGWGTYLGDRSPNFVYQPTGTTDIKVLLKNYKLSDDVAFRFGNQGWESWPLSADTYANWIHSHHGDGQTINLFMDYETFGEHQWEDTGIFSFLRTLAGDTQAPSRYHLQDADRDHSRRMRHIGEYDVPERPDVGRHRPRPHRVDRQRYSAGCACRPSIGLEEAVLRYWR